MKLFPTALGIIVIAMGLFWAWQDHAWVPLLFVPFGAVVIYLTRRGWT